MIYVLAALTLLASGVLGWYAGRHRTSAAMVATRVLLLAAAVTILVTHGPTQQIVAVGMVGLVAGDLVAGFTRGNPASPVPGRRTS